jgi:hypothetical protein
MASLGTRTWGDTLCLACGETNITSTSRATRHINDPFAFMRHLRQERPKLILNPCHTYMRRYEMRLKRLAYSRAAGRCAVLAVWNRDITIARQAAAPWSVAFAGRDRTDSVREVDTQLPWLRFGVAELGAMARE